MQGLISWSKNLAMLHLKQVLWSSLESPDHNLLLEPASNSRKEQILEIFRVPRGNIIQVKSSNKQIPSSSGSNERKISEGRSPASFRNKRLRAR